MLRAPATATRSDFYFDMYDIVQHLVYAWSIRLTKLELSIYVAKWILFLFLFAIQQLTFFTSLFRKWTFNELVQSAKMATWKDEEACRTL